MKPSKNNKIIYFIVSVIVTVIFDLNLSDYIIKNADSLNLTLPNNLFEIAYCENFGAAFSIFQYNTVFLVIIAIVAVITLLTILFKHINKAPLITCFWFALLTSGIACNTFERIAYGFVRDFFALKFINFPVFNISDILINISVLAIMVLVLNYNKQNN